MYSLSDAHPSPPALASPKVLCSMFQWSYWPLFDWLYRIFKSFSFYLTQHIVSPWPQHITLWSCCGQQVYKELLMYTLSRSTVVFLAVWTEIWIVTLLRALLSISTIGRTKSSPKVKIKQALVVGCNMVIISSRIWAKIKILSTPQLHFSPNLFLSFWVVLITMMFVWVFVSSWVWF